jgi:hypothetical protein
MRRHLLVFIMCEDQCCFCKFYKILFPTHHWAELLDEVGLVIDHGKSNEHGAMKHLQIHTETGTVIRINFE